MGKRVIIIILDGVGVGELPDASQYHDEGSDTLGNLARTLGGLRLPTMERLGLGNIAKIAGVRPCQDAQASFGRMAELSPGKDSTSGHWELCGVVLERPFATFPDGFPSELITDFERMIGHESLGNVAASGTEIIERLGDEHMKTGSPIVYTSADSVFQIAAHKEVVPLDELYRWCTIARSLLDGEYNVGRVIARPFTGKPGAFRRTAERKDYSLAPPQPTLLDRAKAQGLEVWLVGKVDDLFGHRGYTKSFHSVINEECMNLIERSLAGLSSGLVVSNLVQFDMDLGHRNDAYHFYAGLQSFDARLEELLPEFGPDDLVFITADHGCDPTTPSTDHSREYVPLLALGKMFQGGIDLGTRKSFADLARTAADHLQIEGLTNGESFYQKILKIN